MILLVDDDSAITASLRLLLKQHGYATVSADTPAAALEVLESQAIELVVQDMNFSRSTSGGEGLELLRRIKGLKPELPVILITAWGSIQLAVEGMRAGAADFVTKPWSSEQLLQSVRTALSLAGLSLSKREGPGRNREELEQELDFEDLVGSSSALLEVVDLVGRVCRTDASVLITGESGTGKELVAGILHRNSLRSKGPFVKVNLGGIPHTLFESEMFGHVRGAFTDAHADRKGRFECADGGTIFLDEVGDLEPSSQVKLLRVLQDRTYEVLGSSRTRQVDVRVISATNRNLRDLVRQGTFREDLFYRLNLINIELPPLRDRRSDIPVLTSHFLVKASAKYGRAVPILADSAVRWLSSQPWTGNVRQLQQTVERTLLVAEREELGAEEFQVAAGGEGRSPLQSLPEVGSMSLEEMEKQMIIRALEHHGGHVSRAAESLGLSRPAIYRRMEKFGIKM